MRRVGQARRRDAIEPDIVQALGDIGLFVWKMSQKGLGDLMVYDPWACHQSAWTMLEVKSGDKARLTPAQVDTNAKAPMPIVRSPAEAVALFINGRSWI